MSIIVGCACETGNGNTGTPTCIELFGLSNGLAVQNLVNSTGALNKIDISVAITTGFSALFVSTDISTRLYPVTGLRNIDFPQEETQYDTDNTNQKDFLRDGILSFSGEKRGANNVYASKLKQIRCIKNGTYLLTENGVVGIKISDFDLGTHDFYPVPVSAFNAQWMPKKGDAVEKVLVTFDFPATLEIGELWMIPYSELGMTADELTLAGLQDVNFQTQTAPASVTAVTTAEFRLITDYGQGIVNAQNVSGLVTADFVGTNLDTGLPLAVFAASEVVDSHYVFTYTSQTPTERIEIKLATSATVKFEGEANYLEPAP